MAKRKPTVPAPRDDKARSVVSLEVTWQLDAIFDGLIEVSRRLEGPDFIYEWSVIRALSVRGKQLNSAAMGLLGDDVASVAEARAVVDGKEATESEEAATLTE